MNNNQPVTLYSSSGEFLGVFISPELWEVLRTPVQKVLDQAAQAALNKDKEPLEELELLKQHWDFLYPVDTDVLCTCCGNSTEDWAADSPRKFRLKTANLGGLVGYECLSCHARILKRHFKKEIKVECRPYQE